MSEIGGLPLLTLLHGLDKESLNAYLNQLGILLCADSHPKLVVFNLPNKWTKSSNSKYYL